MRTEKKPTGVRATSALVALTASALVLGVTGGAAWAYWSAGSSSTSNGASAASSVNAGATPTVSLSGGNVTVSWTASTLATGQAVSGYIVKRYDATTLVQQTIQSACTGTIVALSCTENSIPPGSWKYSVTPVFSTNWRGAESALSASVGLDTTAPTNNITLSSVTGGAYLTGTSLYYRGAAAGSFKLTNAVADAGSGPASSQTSALTGTTTGWTHTGSTVSSPAGGPYVSNTFSWTAATTSSPGETVTGRDVSNNSAATALSFVNDNSSPTGASISYLNGYQTGKAVTLTLVNGSDTGSGVATRQIQRASAALTDGTCGAFGSYANLGAANPSSPYVDTAVSNATCYSYVYLLTDNVGNQSVFGTVSVAKVDYAGAVSATTGLQAYWRLGEASANLTSSDSFTGAASSLLTAHTGEIGANWVTLSGSTEQISDSNRARRSGTGTSVMYSTATPSSADYSVEADLYVKSNISGDTAGVIGRVNSATNSYYLAVWDASVPGWRLARSAGGTVTYLVTSAPQPALLVGETYRLKLGMVGNVISLAVNGQTQFSVVDSTFAAAGKAGITDGVAGGPANKNDTRGIHLDNYQVTPAGYPRANDTLGVFPGDYKNGVVLGSTGVLPNDPDTAATFDGVNDYVQVTGTFGMPTGSQVRSTELWFKTSSSARQVLFSYGNAANTQEYGLWLDSGSTTMTAWGYGAGNDKTFTMPSALNNGAWHQVVETYDGTSITLYIDGVALTPQAATRSTTIDFYGFSIGAVLRSSDGNYGGFFNGQLDEVSFYSTALSQTTVTNHYQLGTAT
ncbi:MAG: LamG domain-containing protein [Salinibacterium sp.]|nr:MAG: LamG domain-containing protein [Salinibacterium sp.]